MIFIRMIFFLSLRATVYLSVHDKTVSRTNRRINKNDFHRNFHRDFYS